MKLPPARRNDVFLLLGIAVLALALTWMFPAWAMMFYVTSGFALVAIVLLIMTSRQP